jgi:hypothetical protein
VVFGIEKKIEFYLGSTTTRTNDGKHKQYDKKTRSNVRPIQRHCPPISTSRSIIDTIAK